MDKETKQRFFDQTVERLAAQGMSSRYCEHDQEGVLVESRCIYASAGGENGCAVGINFPVEVRKKRFLGRNANGYSLEDLLKTEPELCSEHLGVEYRAKCVWETSVDLIVPYRSDFQFWLEMQRAHDGAHDLHEVKAKFREVAKQFGLDGSKVELFTTWSLDGVDRSPILGED